MKSVCRLTLLAVLGFAGATARPFPLPPLNARFGEATARTTGDKLTISTGRIERTWQWTGTGIVTTGLKDVAHAREWSNIKPAVRCDWAYQGIIDDTAAGKLVSLTAREDDDEAFTSRHLEVAAEVEYPSLTVRYLIWAYPGAPGLRTQLWVKGVPNGAVVKAAVKRADYLPVDAATLAAQRRYIGYFNDTQHRNQPETEILREDVRDRTARLPESVDWANMVSLEIKGAGIVMLKESHKCVNQPGVDTGAFVLDAGGLKNTGWALSMSDIVPDQYRWCWASWVIVHDGSPYGRELAIKQFDRYRYPVVAKRDMWTLACTWGASRDPRDGRNAAWESAVLPEMDSVADLGIDMLLIDDGWAVSPSAKSANPDGGIGWKPHPQIYPDGWRNVAARKEKLGLKLGLWGVAQAMPVEDMNWNWDRLRMSQLKLDFANLNTYGAMFDLMRHVRQFELHTGHECIISWDVTENAARYGYFWAREYGDVHFMNRKPSTPLNVIYIPWLALRDFWDLARYNNLNKWQLTTQNPELVDRAHSDASQYGVSYCTATTLMGIPEFLLLTRQFSQNGREQVRSLLKTYKPHQRDIFDSFVFPVGERPTNGSWTGFQAVRPESKDGYLLLFRERLNRETTKRIALRFLKPGTNFVLRDLRNGAARNVKVDAGGTVEFRIPEPADFLFLKYAQPAASN